MVLKLQQNAAVTALVAQRIYPKRLQQGTAFPAITYFKVADVPEYAMGNAPFMSSNRLQLSCWSKSYLEAVNLVKAIKTAMRGMTDPNTTPPILNVLAEEGPELWEPDTLLHHHPVDLVIEVGE
jgi:hypothetical protein